MVGGGWARDGWGRAGEGGEGLERAGGRPGDGEKETRAPSTPAKGQAQAPGLLDAFVQRCEPGAGTPPLSAAPGCPESIATIRSTLGRHPEEQWGKGCVYIGEGGSSLGPGWGKRASP